MKGSSASNEGTANSFTMDDLECEDHDHDVECASVAPDPEKKEEEDSNKGWFNLNRDTVNVSIWMLVTLLMIGATTAIVLSLTSSFLNEQEHIEFTNGFEQQANVIAKATSFHAKTVVASLESMSDTITSFAGASAGQRWPFITVPDFERRARGPRNDAYIDLIGFSPLVSFEDRERWSIFSSYDTAFLVDDDNDEDDNSNSSITIPSHIFRIEDDSGMPVEDDHIIMVPMWLASPKAHDTSLVNFNLLSSSIYDFLFHSMMESKHTVLSSIMPYEQLYKRLHENHFHDHEEHSDFVQQVPHSVFMTPVYDSFNETSRSLAGVIHGILPWGRYFSDLLPTGADGMLGVLHNSCGQNYTFGIDGPVATHLGQGDLHDPRYNHMGIDVEFGSSFLGETTRDYRQCFYSLTVYPTKEFEVKYYSSDKVKFTGLLAVVFFALALFFFIFVWFVQRRQQKVMAVAVRTTAIISNLFPENVRNRIMKQAEAQANREMDGMKDSGNSNMGTLSTLISGTTPRTNPDGSTSAQVSPSPGITILEDAPIADLYPDCTVFFADLVGFTSWSSTRQPCDVFVLLETLYGAFDVLANKHQIFKVETIGDCYVSVVGLPQPRKHHAVAMARFSNDCLVKSREVFHLLEGTLGQGTNKLDLRVGLHSGPVTAGVLRGEKGRFQLFGDTVNTAARMESNSLTGKIHCSQSTATLLEEAGKKSWVTERPDKIIAKGKGEMTTFWINVKNSTSSQNSNSNLSMENSSSHSSVLITEG